MFNISISSVCFIAAFTILITSLSADPHPGNTPTTQAAKSSSGSSTTIKAPKSLLPDKESTDTASIKYDPWFTANAELSKHFDEKSKTTYCLTRIHHKDTDGNLIKLHMAISNKAKGETVRAFARRKNTKIAINASMGLSNLPHRNKQPVGIQIIDGVVKQELSKKSYTLGIKADNELVAYPPGTTATEILKDGSTTALTAFVPLIADHNITTGIKIYKNNSENKHPRQVIAQYDNKDILFFSCGGRGYDGDGMTVDDLQRVLKALNVSFAFNLDGGGSVSTIIGHHNINKKIDGKGTLERARPNFLYVKDEQP